MAILHAPDERHFTTGGTKSMSPFWTTFIVSIIVAGVMGYGIWAIFNLINKQTAIVGVKTIQLISVVFILPLLTILGLSNIIGRETIGPLVGVIVGYVLTGSWKE
jgi:hypothetical protein